MNRNLEEELILLAIQEDAGPGDFTSLACIPHAEKGKARLITKENGILAGIRVAKLVFGMIDPELQINILLHDGSRVTKGDIAFIVEGNSRSILQSERLVLNFLQRMSGIATITDKYVQHLKEFRTRVMDTRKTTPGLRHFEKEAVRIGGGTNHRMGLFDMIMIKDNHIDMSGSIEKTIDRVHQYLDNNHLDIQIEIEARTIDDVKKIVNYGGINRIMLDNFDIQQTREAIQIINKKFETESSGGITLDNIRDYAMCGVDFVSIGALTHHIQSLDMSLKAL